MTINNNIFNNLLQYSEFFLFRLQRTVIWNHSCQWLDLILFVSVLVKLLRMFWMWASVLIFSMILIIVTWEPEGSESKFSDTEILNNFDVFGLRTLGWMWQIMSSPFSNFCLPNFSKFALVFSDSFYSLLYVLLRILFLYNFIDTWNLIKNPTWIDPSHYSEVCLSK